MKLQEIELITIHLPLVRPFRDGGVLDIGTDINFSTQNRTIDCSSAKLLRKVLLIYTDMDVFKMVLLVFEFPNSEDAKRN